MALTPTQTALCNSLNQQFDGLIAPIIAAKSGYQSRLREFKNLLRNTTFTPQSQIDSELNNLRNSARNNMPGKELQDMRELRDILENCDFFNIFSPASALISGTVGLFDKISDLISNSGITVPEFGLGAIADALERLLDGIGTPGGSNLKELFERADQLINCLDSICGYDVTGKISRLEDLVTDYELDNSYNIDYSTIYSDAGLTASEIQGMTTVTDGIASINVESLTSISDSVSSVKALTKTGGFF
jgi:hypothetical protein